MTMAMDDLLARLGTRFGVLAESNTTRLTVLARNADVAVGDLFLLPCRRGPDRIYLFRTTEYANVLNRTIELDDVARNKLTMPDSYLAEDLAEEQLLQLSGMVLGYAEWEVAGRWAFHRPRRLPQHLSDVFHVDGANPDSAAVVRTLLGAQLGEGGLYVGDLLAGERALHGVPVSIPPHALSHHIGVFGRTGSGKSNLMMVLLRSVLEHNRLVRNGSRGGPQCSMFAIDPHDEFRAWHAATGGADGIRGVVARFAADEQADLVAPFYYLSARDIGDSGLERRVRLSRADLTPDDLVSVTEFSEQQAAFANEMFAAHGEDWIGRILLGDDNPGGAGDPEAAAEYLPGTIQAVQRRLGALRQGQGRVFTPYSRTAGHPYQSMLADIVCALEAGRVLVVDTTLMTELEQFLLTTVVARTLFALRRALRSASSADELPMALRQALGNDDAAGRRGLASVADALVARLATGALPYVRDGALVAPDTLPYVNVVVEEAPSILNPERLRFGSVFRDISRQGRKFGIGLTVVSQQVSEIDAGILTQLNTELIMALGNDGERREAIRNASADLAGFERELQVLSRGQLLVSASYRDLPLPVVVPDYDQQERA